MHVFVSITRQQLKDRRASPVQIRSCMEPCDDAFVLSHGSLPQAPGSQAPRPPTRAGWRGCPPRCAGGDCRVSFLLAEALVFVKGREGACVSWEDRWNEGAPGTSPPSAALHCPPPPPHQGGPGRPGPPLRPGPALASVCHHFCFVTHREQDHKAEVSHMVHIDLDYAAKALHFISSSFTETSFTYPAPRPLKEYNSRISRIFIDARHHRQSIREGSRHLIKKLHALSAHPPSPTHHLLPVSADLRVPDISCEQNHMLCGCLSTSFTQPDMSHIPIGCRGSARRSSLSLNHVPLWGPAHPSFC